MGIYWPLAYVKNSLWRWKISVWKNAKAHYIREVFQKTKWKFKMEFSIKCRTSLMDIISIHFLPTFFLLQLNPTSMKRILHFKNITFKPLIIGSKLTFISSSGRWLPTIKPCSKSPQLLHIHNLKPKLSAKHVLTVREWF